MKFHGRLSPGILRDPETPLELVIHAPSRATGLTVKIWELDTFVSPIGKQVREGSGDDLLAVIEADLAPGPGRSQKDPDWRVLQVKKVQIVSDDPDLVSFRLKLPGYAEVLRIPIVSEEGEAEGRTYELGFSMELGGAEKFRTRSPCLYTPPLIFPSVERETVIGGEVVDRDPLRLHRACVGTGSGDGFEARLEVLACGRVDLHGQLVDESGQPIGLRRGRPLFAYFHTGNQDLESDVPLALCDPVGADGVIVHRRHNAADLFACLPFELMGENGFRGLDQAPTRDAPLDEDGLAGLSALGRRLAKKTRRS